MVVTLGRPIDCPSLLTRSIPTFAQYWRITRLIDSVAHDQ